MTRALKYLVFNQAVLINGMQRSSCNVTNRQFDGYDIEWFVELGYVRIRHKIKKAIKFVGITNIAEWEPLDPTEDLEEPRKLGRPPKDERHTGQTLTT